jgi:hypothetical protein
MRAAFLQRSPHAVPHVAMLLAGRLLWRRLLLLRNSCCGETHVGKGFVPVFVSATFITNKDGHVQQITYYYLFFNFLRLALARLTFVPGFIIHLIMSNWRPGICALSIIWIDYGSHNSIKNPLNLAGLDQLAA